MKKRILDELLPQVSRNCLISDARHWGSYSICGLLLRLRELYRFQKNLAHGEKIEQGDISGWIGRMEDHWSQMQGMEPSPLSVDGREFGPFDAEGVNGVLRDQGLLYGAGYGIFMKPVFFLAELDSAEAMDGCEVYVAGREYARDLSIHPAMLQGRTIFARRYVSEVLMLEKFEELKAMKGGGTLRSAFSSYGIDEGSGAGKLVEAADSELRAYIHHELGETHESETLGPLWAQMLASVAHSRASMFLRGVKDVLADTSDKGMLRHIIDEKKEGSFAFYIVFSGGFRKLLSQRIQEAFAGFSKTGGWQKAETARKECYRKARSIADGLLEFYGNEKDPGGLEAAIERQITLTCPSRSR
jgi:hypothetical protein